MGWDIDVREKLYQRLANEIFFVFYTASTSWEQNFPLM